jgi:serine/threonine protein kinase
MMRSNNVFTPADGEMSLEDQAHLYYFLAQNPTTEPQLKAGIYCYEKSGNKNKFRLMHDVSLLGAIGSNDRFSRTILWKHLLHANYLNHFFPRGTHVITQRDDNNKVVGYLQFKTNIALGVRKSKDDYLVCDVIDDTKKIGEGGYSIVAPISATVKHRYDDKTGFRVESSKHKRVAKISVNNNPNFDPETELTREFKLTQKCPHLAIREPMFGMSYPEEKHGFLSIRRIKGRDLIDILSDDMNKTSVLSVNDRFQISIAILSAALNQLKLNGITHRDIKPENIIAHATHQWAVNFIDLNLSKLSTVRAKKNCGSGHYISREALNMDTGDHSDLFACALVIALIWRDKTQAALTQVIVELGHEAVIKFREKNNWVIKFDMFKNIEELGDAEKSAIEALLTKMTDAFQFNRGTIEEALVAFEKLYLTYKYNKPDTSKEDRDAAYQGHDAAVTTRAKLKYYADNNQVKVTDRKILADNLDIWLSMEDYKTHQPVLPDHPLAILEFIQALDVPQFHGLSTKQHIIEKANNIIDEFYRTLNQLTAFSDQFQLLYTEHEKLNGVDYKMSIIILSQKVRLEKFCARMNETKLDFSLMATETAHMKIKLAKTKATFGYFEELVLISMPAPCAGLGIL